MFRCVRNVLALTAQRFNAGVTWSVYRSQTDMLFTNQNKIKALKREIALRKNVYAKRVRKGDMLQATSDYEIGIFEDMLKDYLVHPELGRPKND